MNDYKVKERKVLNFDQFCKDSYAVNKTEKGEHEIVKKSTEELVKDKKGVETIEENETTETETKVDATVDNAETEKVDETAEAKAKEIENIEAEIAKLEAENAEGYKKDIQKLKVQLAVKKLQGKTKVSEAEESNDDSVVPDNSDKNTEE